jgi:cell division protein FtsL
MSFPNFRPESLPPPCTNSELRANYGASFVGRGQSASVIRKAIDRRGLRHLLAGTLSCALVASAALTHVWLRTKVTERGYLLSKLSAEHQRLLRERERLTLRTGQLSSPARLEELAKSKLSMGPPPAERTVVLVQTAPVEQKRKSALALGDQKRRK